MYTRRPLSLFFAFVVLLCMWVLYGWNYWNGDREGYESFYHMRDTLTSWGGEVGYGSLNILANQAGISFQTFQILIALVTLYLVFRYVAKRALSPLAALALYFICFFSLDYVLMRNFLAFAIILQGILVLHEAKSHYRIKYLFLILLAATVHKSSLLFFVFVFVPLERVIPIGRFFLMVSIFFLTYVLVRFWLPLPESIASHFSYYNTSLKTSFASVFVHLSAVVLMIVVIVVERRSIFKVRNCLGRDRELVFMMNINLFSLFFLVLYFEAEIFIRLLRTLLFLNLFHCVNSLFLRRETYFFLGLYIVLFSSYLVFVFIVPVAGLSIVPLLNRNLLLE